MQHPRSIVNTVNAPTFLVPCIRYSDWYFTEYEFVAPDICRFFFSSKQKLCIVRTQISFRLGRHCQNIHSLTKCHLCRNLHSNIIVRGNDTANGEKHQNMRVPNGENRNITQHHCSMSFIASPLLLQRSFVMEMTHRLYTNGIIWMRGMESGRTKKNVGTAHMHMALEHQQ